MDFQESIEARAESTTWNPNDKFVTDTVTYLNGNFTIQASTISNTYATVRATQGKSSGKWYFETKLDQGFFMIGVQSKDVNLATYRFPDRCADSIAYYNKTRLINYQGTVSDSVSKDDFVGIALDMDNKKISFYKNGIPMTQATDLSFKTLGIKSDTVYPVASIVGPNSQITTNFGATPFKYEVPEGYKAYDQNNEVISSITLDKANDNIQVGETDNLVATTTPTGAQVTWKSSDESVAKVDQNGNVTAVGEGNCIITATINDGSNLSDSCTINVTKKDTTEPTEPDNAKAILIINLTDGETKIFDVSYSEVSKFKQWYNTKSEFENKLTYEFNKTVNSNISIEEDVVHDQITSYEIRKY